MTFHSTFRLLISTLPLLALATHAHAQQPPLPSIEHARLQTPQVIEDVPCSAGPIWRFTAGGRLHRCTLDRDATVRGVALPRGTSVTFNANATHRVVFLPHTFTIDGHACRGSEDNFMTELYPSGRLQTCWLPENAVIQGISCAAFSMWSDVVMREASGVRFYENGRLASCRLSKNATVDGRTIKKGTRIHLDPAGRLTAGERR
jgi:hypothetical protein